VTDADTQGEAKVLVVDDEQEVADGYTLRIRNEYDVETAYGGEEALAVIDESVDVVLLDRRMPYSGDDVLRDIRDRGLDCRVIMLTAIDPGFEILDMPFDDYLSKPVEKDDLVAAIDQQLDVLAYQRLSDYFELASKQAVLENQKLSSELEDNEEYVELVDQLSDLRADLTALLDDFEQVAEEFAAIDRDPER
jgi:DNA-binding response OmpR family regulator